MRSLGLAVLLMLAIAAPAAASFDNSAVVELTGGDMSTGGIPRLYTGDDSTFTAPSSAGVAIDVTGSGSSAVSSGSLSFNFAPKSGGKLKTGLYKVDASGVSPSMTIGNCAQPTGWFEVKDIARDANGTLQRAQILFEQHCSSDGSASFGELRFGEPVVGDAVVTPSELIFPPTPLGHYRDGSVALLVNNPFRIPSPPSLSGRDAGEFAVTYPAGCCGAPAPNFFGPFAPGDVTGFSVEFTPQKAGTRIAALNIPDDSGPMFAVPVEGSATR